MNGSMWAKLLNVFNQHKTIYCNYDSSPSDCPPLPPAETPGTEPLVPGDPLNLFLFKHEKQLIWSDLKDLDDSAGGQDSKLCKMPRLDNY